MKPRLVSNAGVILQKIFDSGKPATLLSREIGIGVTSLIRASQADCALHYRTAGRLIEHFGREAVKIDSVGRAGMSQ